MPVARTSSQLFNVGSTGSRAGDSGVTCLISPTTLKATFVEHEGDDARMLA